MKYAIWDEAGTDVILVFDDSGNFSDISDEGKKALDSIGVKDYYQWLGEVEYPTRWEEYDLRSKKKEELMDWIKV